MTNCIYRIECLNKEIKDFYIGSTDNLAFRTSNHKCCCTNINRPEYNYKLYKFIRENGGWDNWRIDIELLTTGYDMETRLEWEQNYIDCLKPSLNSKNAKGVNIEKKQKRDKEWRLNNKDKIEPRRQKYLLDNKERIKKQRAQHYLDNKERLKQY